MVFKQLEYSWTNTEPCFISIYTLLLLLIFSAQHPAFSLNSRKPTAAQLASLYYSNTSELCRFFLRAHTAAPKHIKLRVSAGTILMQWILKDGFHTGYCTVNSLAFILWSNIKAHSLFLELYVAFVTLSTPSPYPAVMELWGPILCPLIGESFVSQGCALIVHTVSSAASALTMTRFVVKRKRHIFKHANCSCKRWVNPGS